jgi:hypothetical protein
VDRSSPVPAARGVYDRLYPIYRSLYPALQGPFRQIADIYQT